MHRAIEVACGGAAPRKDDPSRNDDRLKHRRDIDGLRALAVLPVMLFHAKLPAFSGGYVGVDVFFVISGYLITTIIADEIRQGRFSISRFYARRARRILPALTVMVATVIAVSTFLLTPDDFAALGASVISTALFYSNMLFFSQSGYFDIETELKPLLHTWSLSVEEQFYLVFPLLMLAATRLRVDLRLIAWCGLLASLAAAVLLVRADRALAFYLAHTRAWELLVGSVLALGGIPALRTPLAREIAAALGVAMIAAAILLYDHGALFPGERAILPCLGAVLVIMAGREGRPTLAARALSSRPLVFVGLISYSLYLWHWPIIALMKYDAGGELAPAQTVIAIVASFLAAVLSWRYVERPFRVGAGPAPRVLAGAGIATVTMAGLGVAGVLAASEGSMPATYGVEIAALQRDARPIGMRSDCVNLAKSALLERRCALGAIDRTPSLALVGDSFAGSMVPALDVTLKAARISALPYIYYSCPSILGATRSEAAAWAPGFVRDCRAYVEATMAEVSADPAIRFVILSNNYDWYLNRVSTINGEPILTADGAPATDLDANAEAIRERIVSTVERLAAAGKTVIFIGASPTGHIAEGARARLRARMKGALPPDAAISAEDCRDATREVGLGATAALGARFVYIDMLRYVRRPGRETCLMVADGVPTTTDGSHPTAAVSRAVADEIVAALRAGGGPEEVW